MAELLPINPDNLAFLLDIHRQRLSFCEELDVSLVTALQINMSDLQSFMNRILQSLGEHLDLYSQAAIEVQKILLQMTNQKIYEGRSNMEEIEKSNTLEDKSILPLVQCQEEIERLIKEVENLHRNTGG